MGSFVTLASIAAAAALLSVSPLDAAPAAEEMTSVREWVTNSFGSASSLPFSFVYDGKSSRDLLTTWDARRSEKRLDDRRLQSTITYADSRTGLEARCEVIRYLDYPAVEWVIYFRNAGKSDTAILEDVRALDTVLPCDKTGKLLVHYADGSDMKITDFAPRETVLAAGESLRIHSEPTSSIYALPFFNVEAAEKGVIGGIGWSGWWYADFVREQEGGASIRAGMPGTRLLLHPGEEIRTPRILLMFWEGDRVDAHNKWRRLLLDHYSPKPGGKPVLIPFIGSGWGALPEAEQIKRLRWYHDNQLPIECFWIDAGWSGKTGPIGSWPENAAIRVPNPDYYPNGLKPISDEAHKCGMKFLLWTWPNRALPGVGVGQEHPEWIVNGEAVDHGNPDTNEWLIEENLRLIREQGIDIYRQDGYPVYPPDSGPDRAGINQIRHFVAFYRFWDALLERYPNLIIDNCSGGGRKIDLETISRSVCLWRSDYQVPMYDPIGMQGQTYGLSFWVPLSAGFARTTDAYSFRSGYSPGMAVGYTDILTTVYGEDYAKLFNYEEGRREMNNYLSVRSCFYGDYYPLTCYSVASDVWMAWQFDRPEVGTGLVQAFRRPDSIYESARFRLTGLVSEARYEVTDIDEKKPRVMSGADLMNDGLRITIMDKPGAVVVTYKRL